MVNGDTLSGALATSTSNIGTYAMAQGTLTNANNLNYTITSFSGVNDDARHRCRRPEVSSESLLNCFIDHIKPPSAADEPYSERVSIAIDVIDGRVSCLCVGAVLRPYEENDAEGRPAIEVLPP